MGTSGEKGTGLGLLLCKDFAEQNDGKLSVTSKPGEGSTFYFTLPKA
jgi:signal transduction histidine kinase